MPKLTEPVDVALLQKDIAYILDDVREIKSSLAAGYVTKIEFDPIKRLVFGLVTLILTAVVVAVVGLVLR